MGRMRFGNSFDAFSKFYAFSEMEVAYGAQKKLREICRGLADLIGENENFEAAWPEPDEGVPPGGKSRR